MNRGAKLALHGQATYGVIPLAECLSALLAGWLRTRQAPKEDVRLDSSIVDCGRHRRLELRPLPQRLRLVAALVYLGGIGLVGCWALGWQLPPFGIQGLWFYSAVAALVLGEFLLEPFFTRPADALANGSALLLTMASISSVGATVSDHAVQVGRAAFISYAVLILALGIAAIWLKDAPGRGGKAGRILYAIVGTVGRARWVFGALYFAAVYAAFSDSAADVALLYLAWVIVFSVHPMALLLRVDQRKHGLLRTGTGRVISIEDPRVAVVAVSEGMDVVLGQAVNVETHAGRVVDVSVIAAEPLIRVSLNEPSPVRVDAEAVFDDDVDDSIIGHVSPGTTIEDLIVQAPATPTTMDLVEAELVRASLGGREVLFQITAATLRTRSDFIGARDLIEFRARKLGIWEKSGHGFEPVSWVPSPGDIVQTFASAGDSTFDPESIGAIPGTTYGVQVDLDAAVTHNTAILGILGSGKTHLAWELMKRLLLGGVKVVALDITGRYEGEFQDISPSQYREAFESRIEAAIASTRASDTVQDNEAGNVRIFRAAMRAELRDWYDSTCPLLIANPLNFDVTKMEGRPTFQGTAVTLSRLTMVETTRIVTEALLEIAIEDDQANPGSGERSRICVILEEAHSLVPEWNAATSDAEKWAVNGTARAVLQGRKYGFGCILVTQRTASVTKSILNQCNTIFALRAYDATGAGFLENYIGAAYAPMLATLKERQAVVFGRASSCAAPIVIRLNEASQVDEMLWNPGRGTIQRCEVPESGSPAETSGSSNEPGSPAEPPETPGDDIPF